MAIDSNEYETSLLTKCYAHGTLPPEVDDEGNIEYKVESLYCHPESIYVNKFNS